MLELFIFHGMRTMLSKTELRPLLHARRQALSDDTQHTHAQKIAELFRQHSLFKNATHIAAYQACHAEINPHFIIQTLWEAHKTCYLPVIQDDGILTFRVYEKETVLKKNIYGIAEPLATAEIFATQLDIVLVPLLGFDRAKHRLGMGKGYYDKTFFDKKSPILIGLAHSCQEHALIPTETHDVALDFILTEKEFF